MKDLDFSKHTRTTRRAVGRYTPLLSLLVLAFLVTFWLGPAHTHANDPTFTSGRNFGTGLDDTWSLTVGDVNGDGHLDLVTGNYGQQNVVYLNDGSGHFDRFGAGRSFGTGGDFTYGVAAGDVDGDGDLDLVAANYDQPNAIYLNDGSGHLDDARNFGSGDDLTYSVTLGDVDGDGHLDVITGNDGQNVVYLNDGAGHFSTDDARNFGTGEDFTLSVALGDVDGDGHLDIVTGNDGLLGQQNVIYLNDGTGQFDWPGSARDFGTGWDDTQSVVIGDMNGDDHLDLVTANKGQNVVYLNDGTGHFSGDKAYNFGTGGDDTFGVAVGDVDGDGDLDLVTGNSGEQNVVYLNDGTGNLNDARNFGTGQDGTLSVALGDVDSDGHLDLVSGNLGQQNVIYVNDGAGDLPPGSARDFGSETDSTAGVAVGDVDGDGDLDLVTANSGQQNVVYLNDGTGGFAQPGSLLLPGVTRHFGTGTDSTASVVAGDVDGDGDLDLVTGNNGEQNVVYLNDSKGNFDEPGSARNFGTGSDFTLSVALGDVDGDGDLDLVSGNGGDPNAVHLNDGAGDFDWPGSVRSFGTGSDSTLSVALGDLDGDGDLDLIAGNGGLFGQQNLIYLNDGAGHFYTTRNFGTGQDRTWSVAVGDVDGDGDLDLVAGNHNQQNVVYLNDGAGNFFGARNFGTGSDSTTSVAVGDIDGDGDLDLVTANNGQNWIWQNDGAGHFPVSSARAFGSGGDDTQSVALGDLDGDGDLDPVAGNNGQNEVYLNRFVGAARLANNPPGVAVTRPGLTANAAYFSTPAILSERFIPISYTLFDPDGDAVGRIAAHYSLDGGGRWYTATAASGTALTNLATTLSPSPTLTNTHVFTWDTFASGVFGQSDNTVLRLEAFPQPSHTAITDTYRYTRTVPGPYQRPYAAATTFPFRLRGTQVRVLSGTSPISNALVYRLPKGRSNGGRLLADNTGQPFRTNPLGYLRGRGTIAISDTLVALLPITSTDSYTLYYTSAAPTPTGLEAYTVSAPGVQTLTVSSANPLVLFNLDVSLEWDGRYDENFMSQLNFDLQRTSEILYDWTNGQSALGQVTVYHDREKWLEAHVRIYATNRMRPSAAQGGVASGLITDPLTSTVTYAPGQVHLGAIWNRYGEPIGSLGEDWPRALAHELGHYAFFLDDNYLGLDPDGLLIPVETCPGAMSDPYRDDVAAGYDEFHHGTHWDQDCGDTLAAQRTGRWDWATITTFYPWLNGVITNTGPSGLPLAVTEIQVVEPVTPSTALDVPIFYLSQNGGRVQPGASARAFLFEGDWLTDLGRPTLDQVLARGARPGDRVCVFELAASRLGCETITPGDEGLALVVTPDWQPEVIVSPITSRTFAVSVTNVPTGLSLQARLFPVDDPAPAAIALTPLGGGTGSLVIAGYSGTFYLDEPALEGYVQVWVAGDETAPRREVVTDYALGGNPVRMRGRHVRMRGRHVRMRGRHAPAVSTDGQVILFGEDLDFPEGTFFTLQAVTVVPSPPSWATVVGQVYRLSASADAPDLSGTSISFNYLGREVPPGEEDWLRVYFWDGAGWEQLPTTLDTYHNMASAPTQNKGLYALMSSLEIPLYGAGWNLIAYPVQETRPVTRALQSIEGTYTTVYGYVVTDTLDPWKVYGVNVPDWVNDLKQLRFGQGYWINVTEPITLLLKGGTTALQQARDVTPATNNSVPIPPATFYGSVSPRDGITPTVGMTVTAWVTLSPETEEHGNLCGQTQTKKVDGQIVFAIDVLADGTPNGAGCGAPGRWVTLETESIGTLYTALWSNNRVQSLPQPRIYLPLVLGKP